MIEGYVYSYAVIIQHSPGFGDDELDEEYLTQTDLAAALRELNAQATTYELNGVLVKSSYRAEWRTHN